MTMHSGEPKSGPWLLRAGEHIEAAQPLTVPLEERYRNRVEEIQEATRLHEERREREGIDENGVKPSIYAGAVKSGPWLLEASRHVAYDVQSPPPDTANPMQTKRGPKVAPPDPANDPMGHLTKRPYDYKTMVDNLVSHFNGANDKERKQGRLWYRAAHDMFHKFAKDNDVSPERAVAMGSAFSPLTDWGDNVYHAQKFMLGYHPDDPDFSPHDWQIAHVDPQALNAYRQQHGQDPTDSDDDLHALADLHGDSFKRGPKSNAVNDLSDPDARANWMENIQHHGMDKIMADSAGQAEANKKKKNWRPSMAMRPYGINTLGSNLEKAKRLHDAPDSIVDMFKVLGGPKISHFTDNILDDTPIDSEGYYQHPNGDWTQNKDLGGTIDSHHVRAVSMPHGGWERKGYASKNPSTDHEYDVFNRGLFEATKRINDAQPDPSKHITPKQLQAIVWLKHKNDKDFFERQKNPVTGKLINHESELGGRIDGREDWQYTPKDYKSRGREVAAALDGGDYADMPALWRKMFMARQPQEWTELLEAWVDHHSPDSPVEDHEGQRMGPHPLHEAAMEPDWYKDRNPAQTVAPRPRVKPRRPNVPRRNHPYKMSSMNAEHERPHHQARYIRGEHDDLPPLPDDFNVPDDLGGENNTGSAKPWTDPEEFINYLTDYDGQAPDSTSQDNIRNHTDDLFRHNWYQDMERNRGKTPEQLQEERQQSKDKAKEIADGLWNAIYPPEEEEGRVADQNMETVNGLMDNGWQPEHIKYDEDDRPYALYQHPSGWNVSDHGGMYKEIGHAATPGEAHDVINVSRNVDGQDYHDPFGPADAHAHIENELHGDPEETGGTLQYLTENDPRIKKYKPRQASRWYVAAPRKDNGQYSPSSKSTQRGNTYGTNVRAEQYMDDAGAPRGRHLDFGAGFGLTGRPVEEGGLGYETFEPNPDLDNPETGRPGRFVGVRPDGSIGPTYTGTAKLPDGTFHRIQSANVLNVLEPGDKLGQRHHAIREIGRLMAPGGHAVITTRGWKGDVERHQPNPNGPPLAEPNAMWTGSNPMRYQKGFDRHELAQQVQDTLGNGYEVKPVGGMGGAAVHIVKNPKKGRKASRWLVGGDDHDQYLDCPHCKSMSLHDEWDRGHCPVCGKFDHGDDRYGSRFPTARWARSSSRWFLADGETSLSAEVSPANPPQSSGTGHPENAAQGFLQTVRNDAADMDLQGMNGKPYDYGASGPGSTNAYGKPGTSWDCSGLAGQALSTVSGQDRTGPPGDIAMHDSQGTRFNTTSPMAGMGLVPGYSKGDLNLGVNPSQGENGHMDVETPSGLQAESKGSGIVVGPGAKPVQSFPQTWHLPNSGYPAGSSTGDPKDFKQMMLPPGVTAPSGNKVGRSWFITAVDAMDNDVKKSGPAVNGNELSFGDWSGFGNAKDSSPVNWGNLPAHGGSGGSGGSSPTGQYKPIAVSGSGPSAAASLAQQASGRPYDYGGVGENGRSYDCSGFMSDVYSAMTGQQTGVRRFNTTSDFASLGFQPGYQPGTFSIGVTPQAGENGHMAGTLPDGTHVESNGSRGVQYGGSAAGATDPQFSAFWHLPMSSTSASSGAPVSGGS